MTHYRIRPGVVCSVVCGESILVATRPARGKCPYVNQLNATGAYFWSLLEQGQDTEQMIESAVQYYRISSERLRNDLLRFLQNMHERGYLLTEDEV